MSLLGLLLHGLPTGAWLWEQVRPHLADRRVVAIDLPGYGERPCPAMTAEPSAALVARAEATQADRTLAARMRATATGIDLRRCAGLAPRLRRRVAR